MKDEIQAFERDFITDVTPVEDDALPSWKRFLDLACLVVLSPLLILLMAGIAIVTRLRCGAPVIFRQERVGFKGRRFMFLKFRTMKAGADVRVHQQHVESLMRSGVSMTKLDDIDDPRMLPGGAFLRASGLDELPQVMNILRGEMSLVGPRPCLPYEFDRYRESDKKRFEALPGITGLWQVLGKNRTTFDEMIALDLRYVREKSLRLDVAILARTIPVVLGQAAAALRTRWRKFRHGPASGAGGNRPGPRGESTPDKPSGT